MFPLLRVVDGLGVGWCGWAEVDVVGWLSDAEVTGPGSFDPPRIPTVSQTGDRASGPWIGLKLDWHRNVQVTSFSNDQA